MSESLPSIKEFAALVDSGKRTYAGIFETIRANVEEREKEVNAFINVFLDEAVEEAQGLDLQRKRREAGGPGPLEGVPVAVKDNILVKGKPCTCASRILEAFVAPYEATAVTRLKEAGAVIVGKTNMDEFAMGSSNENSAFGPVRNPLDTERVAGGSSGGSAAAVAYGAAIAALGSDTGGSARQPASFSGLVGFRPSYGRVSRWGLVAFSSSLDQISPITKNVEDAALIYSIIAGPDPNDSTTYPQPADQPNLSDESGKRLRIGLIKECFEGLEDSRIREAVLEPFREKGFEPVEVSVPLVRLSVAAYQLLAMAEASSNLARYDGIRYGLRSARLGLRETYESTRGSGFGEEVKRRILIGTFGLSAGYIDAYYNTALRYRSALAAEFERAFESVDFLISPTAPTPAFRLGEKVQDPLSMYLADIYTAPAALAALPAISIPAKTLVAGLPVGIQLTAPRLADSALLKYAYTVEQG